MAEDIPLIPEPPEGLKEAALRGILIPFVGAGASRIAGCPDWRGFADGALQFFIDRGHFNHSQLAQINHLNPRVKLSLARGLQQKHGVTIDFRKVLYPNGKDSIAGRRLYAALTRLAKTFVTTNYDDWLDTKVVLPTKSVADADPQQAPATDAPREIIHRREEFVPGRLSESDIVFHLHGSMFEPDGMVMTTQDYVRHYANDRLTRSGGEENMVLSFLDHLFRNKTVLFVGYGLDELEILEYVIGKARLEQAGRTQKTERHYLLHGFYSHERELLSALASYYRECGIQLVPFQLDQKDWPQLIEVLENFAQKMPASAPLQLEILREMEGLLNG